MSEELRRGLLQILHRVEGLHGLVLSDRDGVTILKAQLDGPQTSPSSPQDGGNKGFPEPVLRVNFLAAFGTATEQASKLGMGRNDKIISIYENYQVIQFNKLPVVVTLIAERDANTGHIITFMEEQLSPLVAAVRKDVTAYYDSHMLNTGAT